MADPQKALATQIQNIEKKTGKTIEALKELVRGAGLEKHGAIVSMLKSDLGLGHGDANVIAHLAKQDAETGTSSTDSADPLDTLYVGPKADLRPIHEELLNRMNALGAFESAPKKTYVSYRRKKQFAMIGPATRTQVEVGLNGKGLSGSERLEEMPAGKMCRYRVRLADPGEIDDELIEWIRISYEDAG